MSTYESVFENNKKWVSEKKASNSLFFKHLAEGQSPDFLYIGCSDSRVPIEEVAGKEPGDIFVHRNIANLVVNNDLSVLSVIEYAVKYLDVKHVVICGHYNCGGIKAAMTPQDMGVLNPWLRNIRDVYRLHQVELDAIADEELRYRRLVELNVEEQCVNVLKTAVVQQAYLEKGYPQVHGWVFDVHTGELIDQKINFKEKLRKIREIYDLGNTVLAQYST